MSTPLLLLTALLALHTTTASPLQSSFAFPSHPPTFDLLGATRLSSSAITMTPTPHSPTTAAVFSRPLAFGRMPSLSTHLTFSATPSVVLSLLASPLRSPRPALTVSLDASTDRIGIGLAEFDAGLALGSGERLQCWIDYEGKARVLEARMAPDGSPRPSVPLFALSIDLSGAIWREEMFVGLSSRSSNSTRSRAAVTVYDWSFLVRSDAPYRMHSQPFDPSSVVKKGHGLQHGAVRRGGGYDADVLIVLAAGAACGAAIAFLVLLAWSGKVRRGRVVLVEYPSLAVECGYEKISVAGEKGFDGVDAEKQ